MNETGTPKEKLKYIDGLKGTGALIVYLCHFAYAFYFALYSLDPLSSHTAGNVEIAIGRSPLNILYNGNFAVQLFFVASGFVLCIGYFRERERKSPAKRALKRYLRLMMPILLVNTVIFFLMKAGLYQNTEAAVLAKSEAWFANFNNFEPGYSHALREAVIGCFLFGHNYFNGVLWTVKYLFLGALLLYVLTALVGDRPFRYAVYAAGIVLLFNADYAGFLIGLLLCDLVYTKPGWMEKLAGLPALSVLCLILGVYLGSYPSIGGRLTGSIYGFLPVLSVLYHRAGAALILYAVLMLKPLQQLFGSRFFVKLGDISFSWYLLHFPVIAVCSSAFLLKFYERMNYHLLMLVNFVLTTGIVWGLSVLMTRGVEKPWNRLLQKVLK